MTGVIWYLYWQLLGLGLARTAFAGRRRTVRLWLGSVIGTVASMWAPVLAAFALDFTVAAHTIAAACGALAAGAVYLAVRKQLPQKNAESCEKDKPLLYLLVPFFFLWLYLVWSHTLRPVNGAMFTGQCTYGDMSMHIGFMTSLAEQRTFPPYYNILPGTRISYPFLCDSVSSSMYLLGSSLRTAYMIPMLFAFLQFACGFWFLAREVCREKRAPILAFLLFFLNGGLGMIYFIKDYSLHDLFTGFYKTPTNLVEKGMRWVNVIADMLLPQRATLFGWAAMITALYLLFLGVFRYDEAAWLPAGIIGGTLPMIHTHSFFALGLVAASWMACSAFRDRLSKAWFRHWMLFGFSALALAFPQLLIWTFRSVSGNAHFLRLNFDWVNNGNENWFWFWFKNVGPLFVIMPIALIFGGKEERMVFSGAAFIFVICEFLVFQPNVYDDNKLLYVGYFFCCFLCSDAVERFLDTRISKRAKPILLSALLIVSLNAGVFTLIREVLSGTVKYGYELYSADEIAAAEYIMENTRPDDTFLTDDNHDNTVAVLTGRNIVCGSSAYLYFHGIEYGQQCQDAETMLTDPEFFERNKDAYDLDFVYVGYHERAMNGMIDAYLSAHYPVFFSSGDITIYDLR